MSEEEKPKRCRHLNGEFIELWDGAHYRTVTGGIMENQGDNEEGNIIGYEYRCDNCKRTWRAKTALLFKPKWLKKIGEQL